MLTLCLDTSHKYLSVSIIKDQRILASYDELCFKKQSESIFPVILKVVQDAKIKKEEIDSVCISIGPGSYTGLRIALTIAKVMCSMKRLDLYVISTLKLYANNMKNTYVMLDARGNRIYHALYDRGKVIIEEHVTTIDELNLDRSYHLVGDASLLGLEDHYECISECFLNTKADWEKVDSIHTLIPSYLKSDQEYIKS